MTRVASLTDVEGVLVGHCTLSERPTGCTVITSSKPFVGGVDVRGGAPGCRETELLKPENTVEQIDAIVLSGGSAFGLETAAGVSRYLEERGRGFDVKVAKVPIVCGAILFDLWLGDPKIRPGAEAGYKAISSASAEPVPEGNVGAGAGATVGKMMGPEYAMRGALGSWAISCPDGLKVGALVAVNAMGNIIDPESGRTLAGARKTKERGFVDIMQMFRSGYRPESPFAGNTVIGVVATNARLTKAQCTRVAQMAHDGLARCIYPCHSPWDGDTVFSISTGVWDGKEPSVGVIGALAADAVAAAIIRGVVNAESWGDFPSAGDYGSR